MGIFYGVLTIMKVKKGLMFSQCVYKCTAELCVKDIL